MMSRPHRVVVLLLSLAAGACGERSAAASTSDAAAAGLVAMADPLPAAALAAESARAVAPRLAAPVHRTRLRALSPLADSVARLLVWAPRTQTWFAVAARGKRMVVDLGRADVDPRGTVALDSAFREAAARTAPLPVGTRFLVRGAWGSDTAAIAGYAWAANRVVAELAVPRRLDSLARRGWLLPGAARLLPPPAERAAAPAAPADTGAATPRVLPSDTCTRGALPPALAERADVVRDSLALWLFEHQAPPFERFTDLTRVESSRTVGCFGVGRVALVVSLRAGANEWLRERAVILDDSGRVAPLRLHDLRFRAHELLTALDADGDGIDDLATRAVAERAGAISVLRLVDGRRAERLASGFAWEAR